jgi:lysophospholipase L1-like esterase
MQGRSLIPVFKNHSRATSDWRDSIYYAYYENDAVHEVPIHDGIRTQRYKAMFFPRGRQWQLFDLIKDPQEMHSVHADKNYQPILRGLQQRYHDLKTFYDVNTATIPMTRGDEDWWKIRNQTANKNAQKGGYDLAFIGDSITQGWEGRGKAVWEKFYGGRNAINLGFGGDRTEHVIWRLTRGNLSNVKPKVAVLMIGTNNTGHHMQKPSEVAAGVRSILDILDEKTPGTKVLLLGIFPRGKDPFDEKRLNNIAINQLVRRFADGDQVQYLNIGETFLESDGTLSKEIMPDLLHLNEEGYKRWANSIETKLVEMGL